MKKPFVQKPIAPIHRRLVAFWWLWIVFAVVVYPLALTLSTGASLVSGVVVQAGTMLLALLFTVAIMRGKSPYLLICANLITLIYLGSAGVLAFIRYYEGANTVVWLSRLVEFGLLLFVNYYLFILLKRLPPMHTQNQRL